MYNTLCVWCASIRDVNQRKELNHLYEIERARLLQQLTHIGLSNSVISLAEKYLDFHTLISVCEDVAEPRRSEMLHDYMIHFASEVRHRMTCCHNFKLDNLQRVLQSLCSKNSKSKVWCWTMYKA